MNPRNPLRILLGILVLLSPLLLIRYLAFHSLGERIELRPAGTDLVLRGWLQRPDGASSGRALILHGSNRFGIRLPLYRILAADLERSGFEVFLLDLRGFGGSDDPDPEDAGQFDFRGDIRAAVERLGWRDFHLVGHSFGGAIGMSYLTTTDDPRVLSVVAIGPPRRMGERALDPGAPDFEYFRQRISEDMRLDRAMSPGIARELLETLDLESMRSYFQRPDHRPLLLIDGELERPDDLAYLEDFYRSIAEPKRLVTISRSDHYANARSLFTNLLEDSSRRWDAIVKLDPGVMRKHQLEVREWLLRHNEPGASR